MYIVLNWLWINSHKQSMNNTWNARGNSLEWNLVNIIVNVKEVDMNKVQLNLEWMSHGFYKQRVHLHVWLVTVKYFPDSTHRRSPNIGPSGPAAGHRCLLSGLPVVGLWYPLLWRHNGCDGVSNHKPHDCLINWSFRPRSKKTSKFRVTCLCEGNSPVTAHKWPVTRKMFPFDDVIMQTRS